MMNELGNMNTLKCQNTRRHEEAHFKAHSPAHPARWIENVLQSLDKKKHRICYVSAPELSDVKME